MAAITPDEIKEIKKALAFCLTESCFEEHDECPYHGNYNCMTMMAQQALAYINELEGASA